MKASQLPRSKEHKQKNVIQRACYTTQEPSDQRPTLHYLFVETQTAGDRLHGDCSLPINNFFTHGGVPSSYKWFLTSEST